MATRDSSVVAITLTQPDLPAINSVINEAVMAWPLADRVKRLSIPVLSYSEVDLKYYRFEGTIRDETLIGLAAWDDQHSPEQGLLHGLYIHPGFQHQQLGTRLLSRVLIRATQAGLTTLLIKAERPATAFFEKCGFTRQPAMPGAHPYQYLIPLPWDLAA